MRRHRFCSLAKKAFVVRDDSLKLRNLPANRFNRCEEVGIAQQDLGAAVIQDRAQLPGLQADIEHDQHRADKRDCEMGFQRAQPVTSQHGNSVAWHDTSLLQRRTEALHALLHLAVGEAPLAIDHRRAVAIRNGVAGKKF